jgi:hypothetical protein
MIKRNAMQIVEDAQRGFQGAGNYANYDIWDKVEEHIHSFIAKYETSDFFITAKSEGWMGDLIKKSHKGLLGYLRTGFVIQIKALEKLDDSLPIYQNEFVDFFKSEWFRNTALQNGFVKPIYKKEHFDLLKKNY